MSNSNDLQWFNQSFPEEFGSARSGPWVSGINVSGSWVELYANPNRERTQVVIHLVSGAAGAPQIAGAPYIFVGRSGDETSNAFIVVSGFNVDGRLQISAGSGVRLYGRTESDAQAGNVRVIDLL